eukprot:scaffold76538_cov62-Attheya_sp.AAC.6
MITRMIIAELLIENIYCTLPNVCKKISDTGNRTPVSRVTGGDTSHYTMSEECASRESNPGPNLGKVGFYH